MINNFSFDGWNIYPLNLFHSALDTDANRCNEELTEDAKRLFIPPTEPCQLKAQGYLSCDGRSRRQEHVALQNADDLQQYIDRKKSYSNQVFLIDQAFSWGSLLITEELFRKLLTALMVHPSFLEVVHTFGERIAPVEESCASLFTRLQPEPSSSFQYSYDITYNFKYVARHGRSSPQDPFSVRQVGVYHKFQATSAVSTWLLLQAPDGLKTRLASAFEQPGVSGPVAQLCYHALLFQCLSEEWQNYANYLEDNLTTLIDRSFYSNIAPATGEGTINADFGDIRQTQVLIDKLKRLAHILQLNTSICRQLQAFYARVSAALDPGLASAPLPHDVILNNCIFQLETHATRLKSMITRSEGTRSMIEHILNIRTAQTAHNMNAAMHELSKRSAEENKLMRILAFQSTKDTRCMRVIAFISCIFLPATFVATFFGSNFFGFESTSDGHVLAMASNVWIYLIVTLALSTTAMASWYWWYSRTPLGKDRDSDVESQ